MGVAMFTVEESIDIGCAADDVFAYVSDQTNAPRWQLGFFRLHWPLRTRDACTADVRL